MIREAYGLSISELSDETGISRVTLSRYENGQKNLRVCRSETLIRIADALQVENVRDFFMKLPEEYYRQDLYIPLSEECYY